MKEYEKPKIVEEQIILEDIIAVSKGDSTQDGDIKSILDLNWEDA